MPVTGKTAMSRASAALSVGLSISMGVTVVHR
jgi:hypothetical protein